MTSSPTRSISSSRRSAWTRTVEPLSSARRLSSVLLGGGRRGCERCGRLWQPRPAPGRGLATASPASAAARRPAHVEHEARPRRGGVAERRDLELHLVADEHEDVLDLVARAVAPQGDGPADQAGFGIELGERRHARRDRATTVQGPSARRSSSRASGLAPLRRIPGSKAMRRCASRPAAAAVARGHRRRRRAQPSASALRRASAARRSGAAAPRRSPRR